MKKRTKRKKSKLVPILWIITLALPVLYLFYSKIDLKKITGFNFRNIVKSSVSSFGISKQNISASNSASSIISGEVKKIKVKLYLAKMGDKFISLVPVEREILKSDTPLKDTIISLINFREEEYLNLIPINTKVKNVWLKDSFAHIDFNEEFNYNSYGVSGYNIQIYQIVYTTCQFEGIKGVYFYIEGKPVKYLGGEGFLIQNPVKPYTSLPRFSF